MPSVMTDTRCLPCFIILTLCTGKSAQGQLNSYKPNYNFQTVGRQSSPAQNVLPNKNNYNTALNYGKNLPQPLVTSQEAVLHLEVMDFFVPSYPFAGDDVEMTCGYKHQDGLTFQKIEWHRVTDHSEKMFFRYINDRGSVYSHDWIDESLISYHIQEIDIGKQQFDQQTSNANEDKATVLKLKLHIASSKISGKYECRVFMAIVKKKATLLVPASRSAIMMVTDKNDPEDFKPNIRIENNTVDDEVVLDCLGDGSPAPYLVWSSVKEDGNLESLEENLEFSPIEFDDETGTETSKIRLTGPFSGQYACTAYSRRGLQEVHFVETSDGDNELNWKYKGTTTTAAPVVVEEPDFFSMLKNVFTEHTYWILIGACILLALLLLIATSCCCCCYTRRRKRERRRMRAIENLEAEKIRSQMLLYRGRSRSAVSSRLYTRPGAHRSISRRSTKRRAPEPVTSVSTSTLSMTP